MLTTELSDDFVVVVRRVTRLDATGYEAGGGGKLTRKVDDEGSIARRPRPSNTSGGAVAAIPGDVVVVVVAAGVPLVVGTQPVSSTAIEAELVNREPPRTNCTVDSGSWSGRILPAGREGVDVHWRHLDSLVRKLNCS